MALGAMRARHELGRDIPGDISIVGFDDMEETRSFWPPLTTIRRNFGAVGRLCIQKLPGKVPGADTGNSKTLVPAGLVARSSTGRPPA
jgi:DNA-binding LacI/PurR family transcriptional regulator